MQFSANFLIPHRVARWLSSWRPLDTVMTAPMLLLQPPAPQAPRSQTEGCHSSLLFRRRISLPPPSPAVSSEGTPLRRLPATVFDTAQAEANNAQEALAHSVIGGQPESRVPIGPHQLRSAYDDSRHNPRNSANLCGPAVACDPHQEL